MAWDSMDTQETSGNVGNTPKIPEVYGCMAQQFSLGVEFASQQNPQVQCNDVA